MPNRRRNKNSKLGFTFWPYFSRDEKNYLLSHPPCMTGQTGKSFHWGNWVAVKRLTRVVSISNGLFIAVILFLTAQVLFVAQCLTFHQYKDRRLP